MSDDTVHAEVRDRFGKGFARRLRAAGKIPAVIYGHGAAPQHVALPGHQVALLIRRANAVLELDIAGAGQLVLVKDVQKDPVHQIIEHIDLLVVRRGEKLQVDVPVVIVGEPVSGTIANLDNATVSVEVEATSIPSTFEVDVEGLEDGSRITAGDIRLPAGATLVSDPETLVVGVSVPAATLAALDEIEASDEAVAEEQSEESEEAAEAAEAAADAAAADAAAADAE